MNWMTSGRHRALRSKRGKKRTEMHFPAHVQREAVRVRRHPLVAPPARETSETAWYIRPIMDANESHDIQMLEFAREAATESTEPVETTTAVSSPVPKSTITATAEVHADKEKENEVQGRRCVFTPVKANRSRPRQTAQRPVKKAVSPLSHGLLLFNEGEQVSKAAPAAPEPRWTTSHNDRSSTTRFRRTSAQEPIGSLVNDSTTTAAQADAPFYACSSSSDEDSGFVDTGEQHSRSGVVANASYDACDGDKRAGCDQSFTPPASYVADEGAKCLGRNESFTPPPRWNMLQQLDQAFGTERPIFEQESHSTRNLPGESDLFEDLRPHLSYSSEKTKLLPASSAFNACLSQDSNKHAVKISANDVAHGESKQHCRDTDDSRQSNVDDEAIDSASSQGSFVLPPPVDWHKEMITRHKEVACDEDPSRASYGDQVKSPSVFDLTKGSFLMPPRVHDTSHGTHSWMSTSRTLAILAMIETGQSLNSNQESSEELKIRELQEHLREQESAVIYLHTLLQCHRIDEAVASHPPFDSQHESNEQSKD